MRKALFEVDWSSPTWPLFLEPFPLLSIGTRSTFTVVGNVMFLERMVSVLDFRKVAQSSDTCQASDDATTDELDAILG
eukprot:5141795-Amphidinium_carterae.1